MSQMDFFMIIGSVVGVLMGVAAVFAAIGYYRQGKKQEIIDGQTEKLNSIALLKEEVGSLRAEVKKLTEEVHTLKKENEDEKRKFVEAILAIQGKDSTMTEFIKKANEYMLLTSPTIDTLKRYLEKQSI